LENNYSKNSRIVDPDVIIANLVRERNNRWFLLRIPDVRSESNRDM